MTKDDFALLSGQIKIGCHIHIGAYVAIYGSEAPVELLDFCGLSPRVTLMTMSDDSLFGTSLTNPTIPDRFKSKGGVGPITVGRHAILFTGSVLLPKTNIGEGAVVGALSVACGEVEEWSINRGNPATKEAMRRKGRMPELEAEFLREYGEGTTG